MCSGPLTASTSRRVVCGPACVGLRLTENRNGWAHNFQVIPRYLFEDFTPRALLLERLEVVKAHVATGEQSIAQQKWLIDKLVRAERPTTTAYEILRAIERTQAMYLEHRDRLERELAIS